MAEAEAWAMIPKIKDKGTDVVLDIMPIVLCKNCKWYDPFPMCKLLGTSDNRPDFFCADGERR